MAKAWIFQRSDRDGAYYVGWYTPTGKRKKRRCGTGSRGRKVAEQLARQIEAELLLDQYDEKAKATWQDFRRDYEQRELERKGDATKRIERQTLDAFERIVCPKSLSMIDEDAIDRFRAGRRKEAGKKAKEKVSAATINKELRHLRAIFKKAFRWGYLDECPTFEFEGERKELPRFMLPEHFKAIYTAARIATMPKGLPAAPADWWRGVLVFAWYTGWRIGEILSLKTADVDWNVGMAYLSSDQKGRRATVTPLHPHALTHAHRVKHFELVFHWPHHQRTLYAEFQRIQKEAGIHLDCRERHEHTDSCHLYGFHDIRRSFATLNAAGMSPAALQSFMRHASLQTTLNHYVDPTEQAKAAVAGLYALDFLKSG